MCYINIHNAYTRCRLQTLYNCCLYNLYYNIKSRFSLFSFHDICVGAYLPKIINKNKDKKKLTSSPSTGDSCRSFSLSLILKNIFNIQSEQHLKTQFNSSFCLGLNLPLSLHCRHQLTASQVYAFFESRPAQLVHHFDHYLFHFLENKTKLW